LSNNPGNLGKSITERFNGKRGNSQDERKMKYLSRSSQMAGRGSSFGAMTALRKIPASYGKRKG
jgi:hypothetical protein